MLVKITEPHPRYNGCRSVQRLGGDRPVSPASSLWLFAALVGSFRLLIIIIFVPLCSNKVTNFGFGGTSSKSYSYLANGFGLFQYAFVLVLKQLARLASPCEGKALLYGRGSLLLFFNNDNSFKKPWQAVSYSWFKLHSFSVCTHTSHWTSGASFEFCRNCK